MAARQAKTDGKAEVHRKEKILGPYFPQNKISRLKLPEKKIFVSVFLKKL